MGLYQVLSWLLLAAGGLETGNAFTVQPGLQKAKHCFTNQDRSLMNLSNICDQADCPKYLMDKVLAQLKVEMTINSFDTTTPSITQRNPFIWQECNKSSLTPSQGNPDTA